MSRARSASSGRRKKRFLVQKPRGQLTDRVQRVGPEHFGILSVDCAKARSKYMLANFYGEVLLAPTVLVHSRGDLRAALAHISRVVRESDIRDLVAAIERTGEYHRVVQRTIQQQGWEARLVHPLASKHFRQVADPGIKTDDTDLAGIHRAAVNGFGLQEPIVPAEYQQLQLLVRHRRDLVRKMTRVCNQLREVLHAAMPGYAACFSDLWQSPVALLVARATGSAAAVQQAGLAGLERIVRDAKRHCLAATLAKIQAWAEQAPPAHPHLEHLLRIIHSLDDDRQRKNQEIMALERDLAGLLTAMPYILLLAIPGLNVVSVADLAGELGPMSNYATANHITGRAGLMPSRYQSDRVDRADGPLPRAGHRRIRGALMQIADNLVTNNLYFAARAERWRQAHKNACWIRVKVAKIFSRLAFAIVNGRQLFPHSCCQPRHYILDKLLAFHREHDTPMTQVLRDLHQATQQLPRSTHAAEAEPLQQRLQQSQGRRSSRSSRSRRPQALGEIIPIVLARLGVGLLPSEAREGRDPD